MNVNAGKIALAKGKRENECKNQGTVMAASAPDVCPHCRGDRLTRRFLLLRERILTECLYNKKTARKLLNWQWIDPKVRMGSRIKRESDYHTNEMFNGLYIAEASKSLCQF